MTTPQPSTDTPRLDEFDSDVRVAAWRLLANAHTADYLPDAVARTLAYHPDLAAELLTFLATFGFQTASQVHGGDEHAARFIGDELEIAEFVQLLDHLEQAVSELGSEGPVS